MLNAIKNGGTGQGRMPTGLLEGEDAEEVASYVAKVAGPVGPARDRRQPIVTETPAACGGFSVRRVRCAASMAASIQAEAPPGRGAWGNQLAVRPGANRADPEVR